MKIHILILFLLFQVISCQKSTKNNDSNFEKAHTSQNVDFVSYPIDDLEGITSTRYDGIYRSFDFRYTNGETTFILVPKIGGGKWYNQQTAKYKNQDTDAAIEKNLNQQSFKNLSKEFDIWIFHTPKEFLKHTPNMDAPYTPLIPRNIFFYKYDSLKNSYTNVDMFLVNNEKDEAKANEWRENIIAKLNIKDNHNYTSLEKWIGTFINSDDENLNSYKEIKKRIGWYEVKISSKEILYQNDNRMESEFPTESPGGYSINYKCDYIISGDTIKLYEKAENDSQISKNLTESNQKPILTLFKKSNQFYGISSDITDAESLDNAARKRNKSPYLFYKFDLNEEQ